jgi:hypothetical protein
MAKGDSGHQEEPKMDSFVRHPQAVNLFLSGAW